MEGKPFAIIETDGHSGDAGTKTRVEAFLHCVREDWPGRAPPPTTDAARLIEGVGSDAAVADGAGRAAQKPNLLKRIELDKRGLPEIRRAGQRVLIPRMGVGADSLAACLRGIGVPAEALPEPDRETVRIGRRYTSGKECVPMCVTLGSLLQRIEQDRDGDEQFAFFMPTACGPCRFGVYNVLHKIVLERLGWKDRVRVWSPVDADYFRGLPPGFAALVFTGFVAVDMLLEALYDVRPVERREGAARVIWQRYNRQVLEALEQAGRGDLSVGNTLMQLVNGRHFGTAEVLRRAAAEWSAVKRQDQRRPTVALVGEIYVRCDPFANDFVVDKLERQGIRVRFAPFSEWLEYTDYISRKEGTKRGFGAQLSSLVQRRIQERLYGTMAAPLGWPSRTRVRDSLAAAAPYLRRELTGEAVLTLGGPLHEWRHGQIDGVVSVGPLECMPNKIAEAQFFHVAEHEGLASLSLPLNGDPLDPEVIDNFAFEVKTRFYQREERKAGDAPFLSQFGK
jgi:predicted nucleotide-binding protein (sugar kinase/HSP70/actin superfamily)